MKTHIGRKLELDYLQASNEYADYICDHAFKGRVICNGDTLVEAMEDGYLFEEFLLSLSER